MAQVQREKIVPAVRNPAPAPQINGLDAAVDDNGAPQTQVDRIALALSTSVDARSKVKLIRDGAWCADFKPDEWERGGLEAVRRRFGPGTYLVLVYGKMSNAQRFGIVCREDVEIVADLAADAPSEAPRQVGAELGGARLEALLEQLLTRQAAPPPPAVDPIAAATAQLKMLAELRTLFAPPPAPKSTLLETVETLRAVKALAGEFGGEGGGEAGWRDLVELIKPILPAIVQAAQRGNGAPIPTEKPDPAREAAELEAAMRQLFDWAAIDAPLEPAVELALDKLPDAVFEALERDDWWATLSASLPQFVPYQAWMTRLRDAVLAAEKAQQ